MNRERTGSTCRRVAALLALLLVACGGGPGAEDPGSSTTTGGGFDSGVGDTGMVLPPFDATTLTGGVLATFAVGQEKFRGWFTRAESTQRLVDAFAGRAAPITSICARLRQGAGEQGHNAPWNWSVGTILPTGFDGNCPTCASSWPTPSDIEAGMAAPSVYNCTLPVGNSVSFESRAFMQVTLLSVIDRR